MTLARTAPSIAQPRSRTNSRTTPRRMRRGRRLALLLVAALLLAASASLIYVGTSTTGPKAMPLPATAFALDPLAAAQAAPPAGAAGQGSGVDANGDRVNCPVLNPPPAPQPSRIYIPSLCVDAPYIP